jgi:hypothetical protein
MCSDSADHWGVSVESGADNLPKIEEIINDVLGREVFGNISKASIDEYVTKQRLKEKREYRNLDIFVTHFGEEFMRFGEDTVWHDEYLDILERLGPEKVLAEAKNIFRPENRTTIIFK